MKVNEAAKNLIASGAEPIAITYEKVNFFDETDPIYRTRLLINSLDAGVLSYDEYRYVAARTRQGYHMVKRHITKLLKMLWASENGRKDAGCFSFPVHAKMLHDGELSGALAELCPSFGVSPSLLCAEVSADMLFENAEKVEKIEKELGTIRAMGCRIAISEIGTEFSPSFRLAKFNFDYAILDRSVVKELANESSERAVGGIVGYLHHLKARVIAPCLETEEQAAIAKKVACDGFSSFISDGEEAKAQ